MDTSALVVVVFGTLLFFGFAVWMAFYSRRQTVVEQIQFGQSKEKAGTIGEPKSS